MTDSNISGSSSRDGRSAEIEKMLIEHERLCMEDLHLAFQAVDAARAIAPLTQQILDSRAAIVEYLEDRTLTSPDPETELIRRVDAFGAAAMGFDSPVEPEASRQKQRYEYARARLLLYVEQNTMTTEEARSVYQAVEYLNFGHAELAAALEKLRRWSSTPVTTEEQVKP